MADDSPVIYLKDIARHYQQGDVRLDICLDCTMAMGIPGGETIN